MITALIEALEFNTLGQIEKNRSRLLAIEAGRLGFLSLIFIVTLFFQIRHPNFLSLDIIFPLYLIVLISYLVNLTYLICFHSFSIIWLPTALLFIFDAFVITSLIHYTGSIQSIFIFLYLVNIIFCGLIFQRKGALFLALITSILFSVLMIIRPDGDENVTFLAIGLNNLGFFSVALLSGYLSEQIQFMGVELNIRNKDLRALQDLNKTIIDNVSSGLITVDLDGKVIMANRSAHNLVQTTHLKGKNIRDIFPEIMLNIKNHLKHSSEGKMERFEMNFINSREEKLLLGFSVSTLKDEDMCSGFILIFQDLTEVKRLERAMQRSEKLAAVGQLAAGIAHEIRNPLASISGSLQLLRAVSHGEGSEEHRLMTIALKEIDRLNGLITDFLDFVRPSPQVFDPVNLNELLNEVVEMVRLNKALKSDIKYELGLKHKRWILGHRDKLKQVFLNLIINAAQALEKQESGKVTISSYEKDNHVWVSVRDNGCGMSESTMKRLFEPFHTTKPKGTGLGLATVHKILEAHEARITVESQEKEGTVFLIEFSQTQRDTQNLKEEKTA